jgi:hypothetical protein
MIPDLSSEPILFPVDASRAPSVIPLFDRVLADLRPPRSLVEIVGVCGESYGRDRSRTDWLKDRCLGRLIAFQNTS